MLRTFSIPSSELCRARHRAASHATSPQPRDGGCGRAPLVALTNHIGRHDFEQIRKRDAWAERRERSEWSLWVMSRAKHAVHLMFPASTSRMPA